MIGPGWTFGWRNVRDASFVWRTVWYSFLPLLLLFSGPTIDANTVSAPHVKVELVAEDKSIEPGRDFWVAVHFELEKQWHVYWANPGDSGEPPRVEWSLPAGFSAGPIEWPYPRRFQHSTIVDYGYEDDVLLLAKIHPPASVGAAAPLAASVKWLVCREICIPGRAQLSLTLPVQQGPPSKDPKQKALLDATRARLPRPMPRTWEAKAVIQQDHTVLDLRTGKREPSAYFFPLEAEQIENAAPQEASPIAGGIRIKLKNSSQLLKPFARLKGVVVFANGRAFLVDAPVVAP
jgi:DsbC/DsbD-like thiol-disulfide interchange protein